MNELECRAMCLETLPFVSLSTAQHCTADVTLVGRKTRAACSLPAPRMHTLCAGALSGNAPWPAPARQAESPNCLAASTSAGRASVVYCAVLSLLAGRPSCAAVHAWGDCCVGCRGTRVARHTARDGGVSGHYAQRPGEGGWRCCCHGGGFSTGSDSCSPSSCRVNTDV